jgi:hypothetical protein
MSKRNADVSTPTYLRSAARGALRATRAAISFLKGTRLSPRIGMVALLAIQAAACADVTAPGRRMDRESVEQVIPAVNDARRRIVSGISDVSVRQQLTISLSNIELALRADDVESVGEGITKVQTLLGTYSPRAFADRQEISAIQLALAGAQRVSSPDAISIFTQ